MLDKFLRGKKNACLQHECLPSLSTCAEGVQLYCPSHTYPAIPYCTFFPFLENCAIYIKITAKVSRGAIKLHPISNSTQQSEKCMLKGCNVIAPQALFQQLYFIRTLFYCLTIEHFLKQLLSKVRHTCWRGASKILFSFYSTVQEHDWQLYLVSQRKTHSSLNLNLYNRK